MSIYSDRLCWIKKYLENINKRDYLVIIIVVINITLKSKVINKLERKYV